MTRPRDRLKNGYIAVRPFPIVLVKLAFNATRNSPFSICLWPALDVRITQQSGGGRLKTMYILPELE